MLRLVKDLHLEIVALFQVGAGLHQIIADQAVKQPLAIVVLPENQREIV